MSLKESESLIINQVMREEYGPWWQNAALQFRLRSDNPKARGSYIEVFTVGKWRAVTSCRANQVVEGKPTPRLRQFMLCTLMRNGGLIPGVRAEDHAFMEVK